MLQCVSCDKKLDPSFLLLFRELSSEIFLENPLLSSFSQITVHKPEYCLPSTLPEIGWG
jgi:hypothetical protein